MTCMDGTLKERPGNRYPCIRLGGAPHLPPENKTLHGKAIIQNLQKAEGHSRLRSHRQQSQRGPRGTGHESAERARFPRSSPGSQLPIAQTFCMTGIISFPLEIYSFCNYPKAGECFVIFLAWRPRIHIYYTGKFLSFTSFSFSFYLIMLSYTPPLSYLFSCSFFLLLSCSHYQALIIIKAR